MATGRNGNEKSGIDCGTGDRGLAMVWAVNVKKTPDNIPTEVEASAAEQAELKQAFDAIAEAYG